VGKCANCDDTAAEIATLRHKLDAAEERAEEAEQVNLSIAVCRNHTDEITGAGCRVCEREDLQRKMDETEERVRVLLAIVTDNVFDGCDIDGGDVQDMLHTAGVLKLVPGDEAFCFEEWLTRFVHDKAARDDADTTVFCKTAGRAGGEGVMGRDSDSWMIEAINNCAEALRELVIETRELRDIAERLVGLLEGDSGGVNIGCTQRDST